MLATSNLWVKPRRAYIFRVCTLTLFEKYLRSFRECSGFQWQRQYFALLEYTLTSVAVRSLLPTAPSDDRRLRLNRYRVHKIQPQFCNIRDIRNFDILRYKIYNR